MIRPEGSWVAIPTPFTEEDEVDYPGFQVLVDFQAENETDGILLMGSTGESTALTMDERREILDTVVAYCKGKLPVFAGTTCGNTKQTIELTQYAQRAGADPASTSGEHLGRLAGNRHIVQAAATALDQPPRLAVGIRQAGAPH